MKRLTTLILLFTIVLMASAQKITAPQALEKARAFAERKKANKSKGTTANPLTLKELPQRDVLADSYGSNLSDICGDELFFFNIGTNDGFVIVSGDERTPAILGYADSGSIDTENIPANMRSWLTGYAREIAGMQQSNTTSMYALAAHPAIEPIVKATWNQDAPYNLQCPVSGGNRCVTGCIATAMAQVLYHIRPEGCKAIRSRQGASALETTTFNWDIMQDSYSKDDRSESAQEMAKLMRYCGQAADMEYGTNVSLAYNTVAADGLKMYFDLSNSCHIVERKCCLSATWDETIYNELSNNRPVLMSGSNVSAGHAFVCDGYDGNGLFHFNWGWGGISNGYFLIDYLDPHNQGIGGSSGGYSTEIDAIIGIKLKDSEESSENISVLQISKFNLNNATSTVNSQGNFTISSTFTVFSMNDDNINNYECCWGAFDGDDNLIATSNILKNQYTFPHGFNFTNITMKAPANGTYRLKFLSRQQGAQTWGTSNNSEFFILTMTVNNNTVTISAPQTRGTNPNYKISNVSITGNGLVNRKQQISMDVENIGDTFSGEIKFIDNDARLIIGSLSVNLDPGESATLTGDIVFNNTGTRKVVIYNTADNGDKIPTSVPVITYVVDTEKYATVTVSSKPATPYTIDKNGVYIISQSKLIMETTVINDNKKNQFKSFVMYWKDTNDGYITHLCDGFADVAGRSTGTFIHEITDLEENVIYDFYLSYYTSANTYNQMTANDRVSVMYKNTATDIDSVITSPDNTATPADDAIYTLDGRRVSGSAPLHGIYIKGGKKIAF